MNQILYTNLRKIRIITSPHLQVDLEKSYNFSYIIGKRSSQNVYLIKSSNRVKSNFIFFKLQFLFSIFIFFLLLLGWGIYRFKLNEKEKFSKMLLDNYSITQLYSDNSSNISNSPSYKIIGKIKIPKINIDYPIFSELSEENLKTAPCKFYGKMPDENSNLCIAAHNYDNNKFFSMISKLNKEDEIFIYDINGKKFSYIVFANYEVNSFDLSPIYEKSNYEKELTLVTCNNFNKNRIIIKAKILN